MKTTAKTNEVTRSGVTQEGSFQIKATGKAFKILSDGLYSDKILAVIRELSCNAYDAHVAAGNPEVPFEVHLPNELEPFFSVKDFGIGLDNEGVTHLYTTYFESTKGDSNDFIGALGLGSKSPFSYVDSFTITSRFHGTQRLYTAFIAENGVPSIALMGSEPTDEVNGLEVSMPVRQEDFRRFEEKAERALFYFKYRPNVIGNREFEINETSYLLEGDNWKIRELSHDLPRHARQPVALQGNVAYPLREDAIPGITKEESAVLDLPIEIHFAIGDLEVAASRESLSYDPRTVKNIREVLATASRMITQSIQDQITNCKTLWSAKLRFLELLNDNGHIHSFLRSVQGTYEVNLQWQGHDLKDGANVPLSKPRFCKSITIDLYQNSYGKGGYKVRSNSGGSHKATDYAIHPHRETSFYIDDLPSGGIARVRNHLSKKSGTNGHLLRHAEIKSDPKKALRDMRALIKQIGSPEIIYTSSLDKPVRTQRISSVSLFTWTGFRRSQYGYGERPLERDNWDEEKLDTSEIRADVDENGNTIYFVDLKFFSILDPTGKKYDSEILDEILRYARQLNIFKGTVLGLRPAAKKLFLAEGVDLVNIIDYIKGYLEKNIGSITSNYQQTEEANRFMRMLNILAGNWDRKEARDRLIRALPDTHSSKVFWNKIEGAQVDDYDHESWSRLIDIYKVEIESKDPDLMAREWIEEWKALIEAEPIFKILDLYSIDQEKVEIVVSYLKEK